MEEALKILVVEDDPEIRDLLDEFLTGEGYVVRTADSPASADPLVERKWADLVILDLMMPREDGLSFCRRIRVRSQVPIIMLTAKTAEIDRIVGLEFGADDYLGKPFNPRELLARIRAVLRRTNASAAPLAGGSGIKRFAGLVVDPEARSITTEDGASVPLTTTEFDLLACFLERPRRVLSRDQLLDYTRGSATDAYDRTIDVAISRLRTKLAACLPPNAQVITTVRNAGYLFNPTVTDG
ncbi:response regulator [Neorhizobium alkalisoli]|jgi:two-component system OmpR family response regulator|uniref:Regulatory protein VirG n=1 Tax=Neorhizobium alkalisoli TaxID=528178 RepID=A0A561R8M8_9HYPH|nr:response regulator transcription factor [Neorhizobium alkalisoli]TWF58970.1 two-component system OmpR family response regulator [Neorhizobium alkalisoli]